MKQIYLEPDEEITSVIEKIGAEGDGSIALVVPKNSSLFQSLVNLKLLAKEAKNLQKEVVIISGNKIGMRLAKQVGVPTYASLGAIANSPQQPVKSIVAEEPATVDTTIDGVPVRQYNPNRPVTTETTPVAEDVEDELEPPSEQEAIEVEDKVITVTTPSSDESTDEKQPDAEEQPKEADDSSLPPIVTRVGAPRASEPFKFPWKAALIALGLLLILTIVTFFLLPKATVTVVLPAEPVSDTLLLAVQTETGEGAVKGSVVTSEQSSSTTITATGKKDIGSKATGTISITNKYRDGSGAGKDQTFAAGTKATDVSTKKVFTLNNSVTVSRVTFNPNNGQPIYDTKTVKVTAVEPGESYNIPKSSFTLAGALDNTVIESTEAFSGGLTKQITVLSQQDLDTAVAAAKAELETKARADLAEKAKGLLILPDAVWQTVKEQTTDKKVDEEAQSVNLTLKIEFASLAFEKKLVDDQFKTKLSSTLTETQELVFEDGKEPTITTKSITDDKTKLTIEVAGSGYKVEKIDKATIARSVKNKSVDSAKNSIVETYKADSVEISISPNWWIARLPLLEGAIRVEYGFANKKPTE
jgi:hypothetical protein